MPGRLFPVKEIYFDDWPGRRTPDTTAEEADGAPPRLDTEAAADLVAHLAERTRCRGVLIFVSGFGDGKDFGDAVRAC